MRKLLLLLCLVSLNLWASVSVTMNGTSYTIPETSETGWGDQVTTWIQGASSGTLQKTGGTFTLTANANFGATYGLLSAYFSTRASSPSSAGIFRLANDESIGWRNAADSANLLLKADSSNNLEFNSVDVPTISGTYTLTNKTIDADSNTISNIDNNEIKAAAGIALNKLAAATASRALVSDGSGFITAATTTATEIGYVNGATGNIQSQIDAIDGDATQTLTNKTIDGDDNTLQDIAITSLKTDAGAPSTFISRDGSGVVISTKAVPTGAVVGISDTQTLTNKTIDGDDNTVQDLNASSVLKTGTAVAIANGGTGQTTQTAGMDALSPTTTKGDLLVDDGTNVIRLAAGVNGQVLTANSGETSGLEWATVAGGGGGGSLAFFAEDGDAPIEDYLYGSKVWTFADGITQTLRTILKVPEGYTAGSDIVMYIQTFHEASSASQLLTATATLIEPGDPLDDTTDQYTSTNTAQSGGDKVTVQHTIDLSSSGQINSNSIAPGDLIKVEITRGTDTSAVDLNFIEASAEVSYSE